MNAEERFNFLCHTPSDMNEHLPTLKRYAESCDVVVEMGVRWVVSTWAFVVAKPKKLISLDIKPPSNWDYQHATNLQTEEILSLVSSACSLNGTEFSFILGDSRTVELPDHDLLFIDTCHNYDVLKEELRIHSPKTKKYIVMHDTVSFGNKNESGDGPGLLPAIHEFLNDNSNWKIEEHFTNCHGLMILSRME